MKKLILVHGKPSALSAELKAQAEALRQSLPVPPHLAIEVFKECVREQDATTFVIDGFPQYADLLPDFESAISHVDATIGAIYVIDVTDELAAARLAGRDQRSSVEENEAFIQKRLAGFYANALPTITALSATYNVITIDGSGTPEAVAKEILQHD